MSGKKAVRAWQRSTVRPIALLVAAFLTVSFLRDTTRRISLDWPESSPLDPQVVKEILQVTPHGHEAFAWTDGEGDHSLSMVRLGRKSHRISLDDTAIIDTRTGQLIREVNEGHSFNLAVAKLPQGSAWGFVGVTRGPTRKRDLVSIDGYPSREEVLVAIGLNITEQGNLFAVTPGFALNLPMAPKVACRISFEYVATYGAEDPRLFWTDAGTIGLTFTRQSSNVDTCRDIGYIDDMRSVFAELDEAMAIADGATPYDASRPPGGTIDREFLRDGHNGKQEKNWVAVFPGPSAPRLRKPTRWARNLAGDTMSGRNLRIPDIHYAFSPALSLTPSSIEPNRVLFADVPSSHSTCVAFYHPTWDVFRLHQSTPFYRLTLCDRGSCSPTVENTVMITVGHAERRPRYAKFLSMWNVTSPYDPISVGPIFEINGQDDRKEINYLMTMVPITASDIEAASRPTQGTRLSVPLPDGVLPGHFFLDDDVLVTMGCRDSEMTNSIIPLRELIGRQRMCSDMPADAQTSHESHPGFPDPF